jgi:pimeloyl-ACP methyl ester carboxylesterase
LRIWRDPGTYIGIVAPRHPQGRRPQNGLILCRRRVNPPAADNPARRIAMTPTRQILFVQGGGAGAHDEWDDKLVKSLRRELGDGYEVRYPRMPDEGDPGCARWSTAIRREMADLGDDAVAAGHSVGATILVNTLAEQPPGRGIAAVVLIAAPFVGPGGWPGDEFELTSDLGARLPPGVPVHVFHGLGDETAPPAHARLYARAIPQARVHLLPGRDHQLNNDLSEVAEAIRISRPRPAPHT